MLLLTIDAPAVLRSNRNQQRMMQQIRQLLPRLYQLQQTMAARQAAAIVAEKQRRFEMLSKASKTQNEKIEAEVDAACERRLTGQKAGDANQAGDTKPMP